MRPCCLLIPIYRFFISILVLVVMTIAINGCGARQKNGADPYVDEALESANHLAQSAFEKGRYQQAAGIYQTVLGLGYSRNDASVILATRYNLALCLMELGQYPEAQKLLSQAYAELALGDKKIPEDLLLLEATILYRENRLEDSWAITQQILDSGSPSPTIITRTSFLRGLIASGKNDMAGIDAAIFNMGQPQSVVLRADKAELQGRLAMAKNKWEEAIVALDQATSLRRESLEYRRMAISLALSAAASEEAGRPEVAAGRYLQAGRSAAYREDRLNARKWLTQAALLFDRLGNNTLSAEANSYLSQLDVESKSSPLQE